MSEFTLTNTIRKFYFDTEFTGLRKDTTLISIGMMLDNDGADEPNPRFYAEFTDYDESQVNEWIQTYVIKNLSRTKYDASGYNSNGVDMYVHGNTAEVRTKLIEWLESNREADDIIFQPVADICHYDMVLLCDLFGGALNLPKYISPTCIDINPYIADELKISCYEAFDQHREDFLNKLIFEKTGVNLTLSELFKVNEGEGMFKSAKHNALFDAMVVAGIDWMLNES